MNRKNLVEKVVEEAGESEAPEVANEKVLAPLMGKNVLVRAHREGVVIGKLVGTDSEFFYLENSRMFWRWCAAEGIALRSFCVYGPKDGSRATATLIGRAPIRLDDLCGMYPLSDEIWQKFMDWPVSEQD